MHIYFDSFHFVLLGICTHIVFLKSLVDIKFPVFIDKYLIKYLFICNFLSVFSPSPSYSDVILIINSELNVLM